MEGSFLLGEGVKAQRYPRQHGNPHKMRHSEQPNEAQALIDQRLREHGHAHGAQCDLRLYMLDEQQARRVHRYEPCAPDSLHGTKPHQNDPEEFKNGSKDPDSQCVTCHDVYLSSRGVEVEEVTID